MDCSPISDPLRVETGPMNFNSDHPSRMKKYISTKNTLPTLWEIRKGLLNPAPADKDPTRSASDPRAMRPLGFGAVYWFAMTQSIEHKRPSPKQASRLPERNTLRSIRGLLRDLDEVKRIVDRAPVTFQTSSGQIEICATA